MRAGLSTTRGMRGRRLASVLIAAALTGGPAGRSWSQSSAVPTTTPSSQSMAETPEEKAFGLRVRAYLLAHPAVIAEAMERLQADQAAEKAATAQAAIVMHRQELQHDPRDGVAGNPNGRVTVVEFFDYRCPFCKAADPDLTALLQRHPNVRMVLKEFPILDMEDQSHISEDAARAALGSLSQGKYLQVHRALLAQPHLDESGVRAVLKSAGVDDRMDALVARSQGVDQHLRDNRSLAHDLGVEGTPAFVVGDKMIAGAELDDIEAAIQAAPAH